MNPYKIDIDSLQESLKITDEKELLKLKLVADFLKITSKMETAEILGKTGLHKADLSRIRALILGRFTIDRIVNFLDLLGFSTIIKVKPKKAS